TPARQRRFAGTRILQTPGVVPGEPAQTSPAMPFAGLATALARCRHAGTGTLRRWPDTLRPDRRPGPVRLAPGYLPAHGRVERWSPRRLVSQPDWQLGRIRAQCAKSLQS